MIGKFYIGMYFLTAFLTITGSISSGFNQNLSDIFLTSFIIGGFGWWMITIYGQEHLDEIKQMQIDEWLNKEIGRV